MARTPASRSRLRTVVRTWWPLARSCATQWLPIKPDPPVTSTTLIIASDPADGFRYGRFGNQSECRQRAKGRRRAAFRSHKICARTSAAEKAQRLLHEFAMILEDTAVSGIREDTQLGIGQRLEERERIDRRHHDVVVAVGDECRLLDRAQRSVGARAFAPLDDGCGLRLRGLAAGSRIAIVLARLQPPKKP